MTNRDIKILEFINRFGKCTVRHVAVFFDLSMIRAYQILSRLRGSGMVSFYRVFHNEPGVYTCSSEGAKFTEHEKIRDFNIASLKHDLKILDVFLEKHRGEKFKTEREIRQNKDLDHYPDLLIYAEDKCISIEVELSRKSKRRMGEIRDFYLKARKLDSVHYYVPGELVDYIKNVFLGIEMFEVHELQN